MTAVPSAKVTLPPQSIRDRCGLLTSRRLRIDQTVPRMPNGTLTQNTARQSSSASSPPATSPRNCPASAVIWLTPKAVPRCSRGKASVRIAAEFAVSIAPPTACTTRQPISHSAPPPARNGSNDNATEATLKITNPTLYIRTRPNMSPSRPSVTTRTAETSR